VVQQRLTSTQIYAEDPAVYYVVHYPELVDECQITLISVYPAITMNAIQITLITDIPIYMEWRIHQ
jgi:hypothetical protein